jgi:hemoglobin
LTLFEKLGGFSAVSAIVEEFYDEIERNDITNPYFQGTDIKALTKHQVRFISQALGGPEQYSGKSMSVAHIGFKVSNEAFDEVVSILGNVLQDNGVSESNVDEVVAILEPLRTSIVSS